MQTVIGQQCLLNAFTRIGRLVFTDIDDVAAVHFALRKRCHIRLANHPTSAQTVTHGLDVGKRTF